MAFYDYDLKTTTITSTNSIIDTTTTTITNGGAGIAMTTWLVPTFFIILGFILTLLCQFQRERMRQFCLVFLYPMLCCLNACLRYHNNPEYAGKLNHLIFRNNINFLIIY